METGNGRCPGSVRHGRRSQCSKGGEEYGNRLLYPDCHIVIDGVDRTFYNVSGEEVHPILYNGTTYLPVRAIGELMGENVDWNEETLTITIGRPPYHSGDERHSG